MAGSGNKALAFLFAKPKLAASAAVAATAVAGGGVATYNAGPGDALWGVQKAVFSSHAQEIAVNDVAENLKNAQSLLSKNPLGADDLGQARNYMNQAKMLLDDTTNIPEDNQRAGLQQLYLQLTQNLADNVPPPEDLPPAPDAQLAGDSQGSASVQASAQLPTWGYSPQGNATPAAAPTPPAQVAGADVTAAPSAPDPDWTDPVPAAATLNQQELGYYDDSWGPVYGYNRGDWYRWGLDGYNPYNYDYTGYDRFGYDRWGFDRWGYNHNGYDRYGYNYAGWRYDPIARVHWHRDGYNEWGQRQGFPNDPRNDGWRDKWYNRYQGYYQNRWYYNDPVYQRRQWDQDQWRRQNPRANDAGFGLYVDSNRLKVFTPVANLSVSLGQFVDIQVPRQTRDLVRGGTFAALSVNDIAARAALDAAPVVQVRRQQDQFWQKRNAEANAKVATTLPYAGSLNAQTDTQVTAQPGRPGGPQPTQRNSQRGLYGAVEAAAQVTTPPIGADVRQLQQEQQAQQQQQQRVSPQARAQIEATITKEQKARPTAPPKQSPAQTQQQTAPSQQQSPAQTQQQTAPSQQDRPGQPSQQQDRPTRQQPEPTRQQQPTRQQERPTQPQQQPTQQQERPTQQQPEPTQQKPASQERPRQEAPRQEPTRQQSEQPRQQAPRQEQPRQEAPREEPTRQQSEQPRQQAPRQEQPTQAPSAPQSGSADSGSWGGHGP